MHIRESSSCMIGCKIFLWAFLQPTYNLSLSPAYLPCLGWVFLLPVIPFLAPYSRSQKGTGFQRKSYDSKFYCSCVDGYYGHHLAFVPY